MTDIRAVHTADLDPTTTKAVHTLLQDAFDELSEQDWDHCLGGVHVLAREGDDLIGHASVVQRQLLHGGRALRAGYVEAVAVHGGHRRRGIGGLLMAEIERVVRGAYDLGALGAGDEGALLYASRGWQRWRGPTSALTPAGVERTPQEDGSIFVLPVDVPLDLTGELTCDHRAGGLW
ncbi:aminoglycoside 2'-N-acetyltransferase I [Saccharopolyspora antimicrobica]|uniref:Aminoglycoside 2'-N-acetyltransferase I n=1 Tax=Saccharopolyspora antimicrobica TaxID=455193 RepID=A0A1I5H3J0_9PSEU|nr:GNAT family N-acetyltransferase [Saccharopolyspora antimicrobica]RKT90096.1 aminoglycoside 2'-N-acetyltransferase I [Saccharopolyspora antimicrobica]SFO42391.1 aminoglycoside 2'-N-acetyltransferase I [Saccharopolyspora antimicrobica]